MYKDYYKKVLEELLEEHYDIDEDNVCGYCGIVGNVCNSCYGCDKNVCDDCDDKIFSGIYYSWYNGSYGFVICPNCKNCYYKKD